MYLSSFSLIIPCHAQGNGLDERFNQTLQNMLVKLVHNKRHEWDTCIDSSIYAYNTAKHESSLFTPFEIMFGRRAILPIDIEVDSDCLEDMIARYSQDDDSQAIKTITNRQMENLKEAKENIKKAQAKQKEIYDKKYAKPNAFAVGEKVLMKDNLRKKRAGGKLHTRYIGPYVIRKKVGNGIYHLQGVSNPKCIIKVASGAHLKIYRSPIDRCR